MLHVTCSAAASCPLGTCVLLTHQYPQLQRMQIYRQEGKASLDSLLKKQLLFWISQSHDSDQKLAKITTLKRTQREQNIYGHTVLGLSSNFKPYMVFWNRNLVWTLQFDVWKHNSAQNHPALVSLFREQSISLNCTGVTGKGISFSVSQLNTLPYPAT